MLSKTRNKCTTSNSRSGFRKKKLETGMRRLFLHGNLVIAKDLVQGSLFIRTGLALANDQGTGYLVGAGRE